MSSFCSVSPKKFKSITKHVYVHKSANIIEDNRELKIEVWSFAVNGFTLPVCSYLGLKISGW